MPYSCYRRSLYITEDWSCVLAFLRCCAEYRGEELGVVTRPPTTTLPPTTTPPPTTNRLILPMFYNRHGYSYSDFVSYSERTEHVALASAPVKPPPPVREESLDVKMEEEEEEEQEFDEDDLADIEDIYVRSKFFESWLWTDIRLPSVPKSDG